jgi:hypothetical protein
VNGMDNPALNLTQTQMCSLSINWYQERWVSLSKLPFFVTTPISRFFGGVFCFHGCMRHKSACFWVSADRYSLYGGDCEIWRWVVHVVSEK